MWQIYAVLLQIYVRLSVKFPSLKMCQCKKITNIRYTEACLKSISSLACGHILQVWVQSVHPSCQKEEAEESVYDQRQGGEEGETHGQNHFYHRILVLQPGHYWLVESTDT